MQKKKNINLDWNESLMSPMRSAIDRVFWEVLDHSCDMFKAQAAQVIKDALNELDSRLRGEPDTF